MTIKVWRGSAARRDNRSTFGARTSDLKLQWDLVGIRNLLDRLGKTTMVASNRVAGGNDDCARTLGASLALLFNASPV